MDIRTVLFDLGNVIIPIYAAKTAAFWSGITGIPAETLSAKLDFEKDIFHRFEKGAVTPGRFRKEVMELAGMKLTRKDFDHGWNLMIDGVYPGITELLKKLSVKYRLGLLSNTNRIHEKFYRKKYPAVFRNFDRILLSHHVGARKPEETFYLTALKKLGALPGETVFLDDRPEFTDAAGKLGIRTVTVRKPGDITEGLKKFGVAV